MLALWSAALFLGGLLVTPPVNIDKLNQELAGQLVDHTHNHGADHRVWSAILCQKRDLYVYLPPGYCSQKRYPVIFWLHGAFGDETPFPINAALVDLDRKIQKGCMPPVIIAAPDATLDGENGPLAKNSLYVNGCSGRFEDHFIQEVAPFVYKNYSCLEQPSANVLSGYSGGGLPAMALGIKHRHQFGVVAVISGPINLRYSNCHDRYFEDFSPCTYRWAEEYQPCQKVSQYFCGLLHVPAKFFIHPVFGKGPTVIHRVRQANPTDLLFSNPLQNGDLQIYIRYAGQDNFNFDAQAESFVYFARKQGIELTAIRDDRARHTSAYCTEAQIEAFAWMGGRLPPAEDSIPSVTKEPPSDATPTEVTDSSSDHDIASKEAIQRAR
ncbi:enterochelin esterase [bacterium]|nr:enterochelin esterase [bacterium]